MSGATAPRSVKTGVISSASAPSCSIVGFSSAQEGRQLLDVGLERDAPLRRGAGDRGHVRDRRAHVRALARERRHDRVGVDGEPRRARLFWRASSLRTSSTSLSAGLARRMTALRSAPRPARPTPSSLRMIDRRWRSGSRMMSLSRSRSTVFDVFSTGSRYWPSPGPVLDLAQRARRLRPDAARPRRVALDEPLADQRLRPHDAARVGAEVLVAGVVDLEHDRGLEVRRDLDVGDRADLDAGDLDVLAGDDEAGVVEDRADAVGVVVVAGHDDERHERGEQEDDGDGDRGSHGPGGTSLGSQSSVPLVSRHGEEPSAAGWDAAPGQRRSWLVSQPLKRWDGGIGSERPARRVVGERERVEDRLDAGVVAVGVVVGGALAEVAEPADELGRVRAQELEHRLGLLQRLAARREGGRGGVLELAGTASSRRSGRCRRRGG